MTAGLPGTSKRPHTRVYRSMLVAMLMMSIAAAPARAEDYVLPLPEGDESTAVDQVIYKGVVGNLLEAVPLPAEQRVQLQRGNALVSSAMTGRSLAVLLGLASPVLMIGGLIWGIWAAANIKASPSAQAAAVPATAVPETAQPAPSIEPVQLSSPDADAVNDAARLAQTQ
jgi:hypothetical protein